jgi:hypothetical protein
VGNVAHIAVVFHWQVDTMAPTSWLEKQSSLPLFTSNSQLAFVVGRSESTATVWYSLNNGHWERVQGSEFSVKPRADDRYQLQLKAADAVGNEFINASAWSWLLDTIAPSSCVVVPRHPCSRDVTVSATACVLDVTSDEGVVSLQYQLDSSSHWVSTNGTMVVLRVSNDGVHSAQLKVSTPFHIYEPCS